MSSVSEKRRRIWRCYAALRRLLRRLDIQEPRVPGSLYLLRRKCGKASCRCARGRPHTAWVLTRSERGQSRLYSVPADQHRLLRERTEAYRRYQVARALWVKNAQKLLEQIDAFAEAQVIDWPAVRASRPGRKTRRGLRAHPGR